MDENKKKLLLLKYKYRKPEMGIIYFKCISTGDIFIGISKDTKADINSNSFKLRGNLHPNHKLQKMWDDYGMDNFEIGVLEVLPYDEKNKDKWERGMGCPDASLWSELSSILGADIQKMLEGELNPNSPDHGNIRRVKFYVCPLCGNILVSTSPASIFCCGRKLTSLIPKKMKGHSLDVQVIDIDYYISFDHEMRKSHFISFVAYVADDKVLLNRLYPEQNSTVRFPIMRGNGKLYGYCNHHGLWV